MVHTIKNQEKKSKLNLIFAMGTLLSIFCFICCIPAGHAATEIQMELELTSKENKITIELIGRLCDFCDQ